jgi:hypothetical protein
MNRDGSPSAFVPGSLLLLACLGAGGEAFALPSDPTNELFAIRSQGIRAGNSFWEYQYGFLDPQTLEFKEPRTWRYDETVLDVGAIDPVGGRFFVARNRSIVVVDAALAAAQERPLLGLTDLYTIFCLEYESAARTLLGIVALRDSDAGITGRLVRIDPGSGLVTPIGEKAIPLVSQAVSTVDWEGGRFFVATDEDEETRLSVLDLQTGAILASPRVRIGSQGLRSIEWDPVAANLLCIFTNDFSSSSLARMDPEIGELRTIGDMPRSRVPGYGFSTLDAPGRRLYFYAGGKVWVADPETASIIGSSPEFSPGGIFFIHHVPLSQDADPFRRGDANSDGFVDLGDSVWLLSWLFLGGPPPPCLKAGDTNDDGRLALDDALGLLMYRFQGGPPPASPFPACGPDPTLDTLDCRTPAGC